MTNGLGTGSAAMLEADKLWQLESLDFVLTTLFNRSADDIV